MPIQQNASIHVMNCFFNLFSSETFNRDLHAVSLDALSNVSIEASFIHEFKPRNPIRWPRMKPALSFERDAPPSIRIIKGPLFDQQKPGLLSDILKPVKVPAFMGDEKANIV
ncbi:hypothetical protein CDAR_167171 [Caerostris darwini]|uniref:Uncharacterized protein n=1 Tax=Caerostris darwini TaxID=1538125 RepID=A0AAV4X9S5_9ARAC|nr:hypothetical protein CDAR_167171 [Caerostris darwini]